MDWILMAYLIGASVIVGSNIIYIWIGIRKGIVFNPFKKE